MDIKNNFITQYYNEDGNPISIEQWCDMIASDKKIMAYDKIGEIRVSTVLLGIDHSFLREGKPIIFETMIFPLDEFEEIYLERYCTKEEALEGHKKAVELVHSGGVCLKKR